MADTTDAASPNNELGSVAVESDEDITLEKQRLIGQILDLQNTLDVLSSKVDNVKEENIKLKSENHVLGQYIENLMSASNVFQNTDTSKGERVTNQITDPEVLEMLGEEEPFEPDCTSVKEPIKQSSDATQFLTECEYHQMTDYPQLRTSEWRKSLIKPQTWTRRISYADDSSMYTSYTTIDIMDNSDALSDGSMLQHNSVSSTKPESSKSPRESVRSRPLPSLPKPPSSPTPTTDKTKTENITVEMMNNSQLRTSKRTKSQKRESLYADDSSIYMSCTTLATGGDAELAAGVSGGFRLQHKSLSESLRSRPLPSLPRIPNSTSPNKATVVIQVQPAKPEDDENPYTEIADGPINTSSGPGQRADVEPLDTHITNEFCPLDTYAELLPFSEIVHTPPSPVRSLLHNSIGDEHDYEIIQGDDTLLSERLDVTSQYNSRRPNSHGALSSIVGTRHNLDTRRRSLPPLPSSFSSSLTLTHAVLSPTEGKADQPSTKKFAGVVNLAVEKERHLKANEFLTNLHETDENVRPEKSIKKRVMQAFLTLPGLFRQKSVAHKHNNSRRNSSSLGPFSCVSTCGCDTVHPNQKSDS